MRTSTNENFKKPSEKVQPRTSRKIINNFDNCQVNKTNCITNININKPYLEEDEFWKDCVELNTILSRLNIF